jgi:putative ABC transport system ATP-binding protein
MIEPVIKVRGLVKVYKTKMLRFKALDGIDLDVLPNEFMAIAGTSGSGKSTLLNMIAGLEKPSTGKIFVKDRPIHKMSEDALVDFRLKHVGFIFQSFNLMDTLTMFENVSFPLVLGGINEKEREDRVKEMLERLGLSAHLKHTPNELSGGQQQRVAIARALITKPEIVFADEPTGNLDSNTAREISKILYKAVKDEGATLLMVTHDIERAKYADRIVHLADGQISRIEREA